MSLVFDIGQGTGLAGATGVRPFLPPLLVAALAHYDVGLHLDGSGFEWVDSPGFMAVVLALAVVAYAIDRRTPPAPRADGRPPPLQATMAVLAMVLGAVMFGAALSAGGETEWPGIIAGMLVAFLGYASVAVLFYRARARLEGGAAALLNVYADVASLAAAGLSLLFAPIGFVVLLGFLVLLVRARRGGTRKYEGLRILR
jgi:uncharacterized membrane protein